MNLNIRRNAAFAIAEVIASGLGLFILYRVVIIDLGAKALGIWSLVLATTSFGRMADVGASLGLGRFVATSQARGEKSRAVSYVETALITNLAVYLTIGILTWLPAYYALSISLASVELRIARQLLPLSLVSFVLMSLTSATTSGIVGQHRSDQKSVIAMVGLFVQLTISLLFVKRSGLLALAWAQIAQYSAVAILGWLAFLRNYFGKWAIRPPYRWNRNIFKELVGYGLKLQMLSIASMVYDPLVKMYMSAFGGLEALALFEMSQRLITQARQLVVTPMQALVPAFAHLRESAPNLIPSMYRRSLSIALVFGTGIISALTVVSPAISYVWLGNMSHIFVELVFVGSFGWLANLFAAPAHLLGIGTGVLKWNVISALVALLGFATFGFIFGKAFAGFGVALTSSAMLVLGAIITMHFNCREIGPRMTPTIDDLKRAFQTGNPFSASKA